MVWIYLIVQAAGLGIIAWSFKAEDRDEHAALFGIGGFLSLCLVVATAPLPVKLLTGFLMVRFRSRLNHAFAGGQEAVLSCFRVLTAPGSTDFDSGSRLTPESLSRFLAHYVFHQRSEQQPANDQYANNGIIDVKAVEVTRWV